jgi:transcriptional regulator with XRE-family HTH domain
MVVDIKTITIDYFYATIVDMKFENWLINELKSRDWSPADLARQTKLTPQAISNCVQGRIPGGPALRKIARAFKLPPEEVFRIAGVLPPKPETDEIIERIQHIIGTYKRPETKKQALEYLEFLLVQEEHGEYHALSSEAPISPEQN